MGFNAVLPPFGMFGGARDVDVWSGSQYVWERSVIGGKLCRGGRGRVRDAKERITVLRDRGQLTHLPTCELNKLLLRIFNVQLPTVCVYVCLLFVLKIMQFHN